MTKPRYKRQTRPQYQASPADILTLACGSRIFYDTFHGDLAAMQAAWQDPAVRARVYARQRARHGGLEPWAARVFGPKCENPSPTREAAADCRGGPRENRG
jgi:hypothetical protein